MHAKWATRLGLVLLGTLIATGLTGCISMDPIPPTRPSGSLPQVVYGQPNEVIDKAGWVFGIPAKLALWDRRADSHDVSPQTVQHVSNYLASRGASDVLVRVNQYDPIGEWKRLGANDRIKLGWKYTGGVLQTASYTLLPGRLFGEDWYNPFTNSLHIYSDIPSLAVAKAAYAADVRRRDYPGTYATSQILPVFSISHESVGTQESLEYTKRTGSLEDVEEAYRILYPSFGGSVGASAGAFLPVGNVYARLAGSVVGHVANEVRQRTGGEG